jgi:N-acetylglutamate synthase-like GNAT family acetyltransferase
VASACQIRSATRADVPLLLELIGALADYERLHDEVVLDGMLLEQHEPSRSRADRLGGCVALLVALLVIGSAARADTAWR